MNSTEQAVLAWRTRQASIQAEMAPLLIERWADFFDSLGANEVAGLLEYVCDDGTDLLQHGSVARHVATEVLASYTPAHEAPAQRKPADPGRR